MVSKGVFSDFYMLHNNTEQAVLKKRWLDKRTIWSSASPLPLEEIRDYFGTKITLYFEFLRFYTARLAKISLLGLCVMTYAWGKAGWKLDVDLDNAVVCSFSLVMVSML